MKLFFLALYLNLFSLTYAQPGSGTCYLIVLDTNSDTIDFRKTMNRIYVRKNVDSFECHKSEKAGSTKLRNGELKKKYSSPGMEHKKPVLGMYQREGKIIQKFLIKHMVRK